MIHVKGHSGNAGNDKADDRVQWGKESGPFCRFNVDGSNHEGDYINAPRPSPRPSSSSPSCVPPSPSLRLATSHSKCMKCKTRPKARRALFTPSTPQPIAISSPPLTSKGGTAAQNHNAANRMKQQLCSIRISQLITKAHQLYVAVLLLRQAAILLI